MKLLFLDLETTGLPKVVNFNTYFPYHQIHYYDSSRIVQIAVLVYESVESVEPQEESKSPQLTFNLTKEYNFIIKPDGFKIYNSHIHNITQEMADFSGIPFSQAVQQIYSDFKDGSLLVAHNILFDRNVLLSELCRYGLREAIDMIKEIPIFCTSKGSIELTKLNYKNSHYKRDERYKQPKLSELYEYVFGVKPTGLHDALADTRALAKIFLELVRQKKFVLE